MTKRLRLHRETVRHLNEYRLDAARGGTFYMTCEELTRLEPCTWTNQKNCVTYACITAENTCQSACPLACTA